MYPKQHLLEQVLIGKKKFLAYYTYPTGTSSDSYIAWEDSHKPTSADDAGAKVINCVEEVLKTAESQLQISRDNKTAVKCKIEGINEPIYFVTYDSYKIICTEINDRRGGREIPLI